MSSVIWACDTLNLLKIALFFAFQIDYKVACKINHDKFILYFECEDKATTLISCKTSEIPEQVHPHQDPILNQTRISMGHDTKGVGGSYTHILGVLILDHCQTTFEISLYDHLKIKLPFEILVNRSFEGYIKSHGP